MSDLVTISPREAVALGATSLTQFGRIFLPKTFRQSSPPMHDEMGQALYAPCAAEYVSLSFATAPRPRFSAPSFSSAFATASPSRSS